MEWSRTSVTQPLSCAHARIHLLGEEMCFHGDTTDTTYTDVAVTTTSMVPATANKIPAPLPNREDWVAPAESWASLEDERLRVQSDASDTSS